MKRVLLLWVVVAGCSSKSESPAPSPAASSRSAAPRFEPPAPTACPISVLVRNGGVWIGTPAGICYAARARDALDHAWLESELRELNRLTGESCAEIASESGTYQELISIMDVAVKVGFVDTALSDKSELRMRFPADPTGAASHCKLPPQIEPPPRPPRQDVPRPTVPLWAEQGAALEAQTPLRAADPPTALQQAPVILVTTTEIKFDGRFIGSVASVPRDTSVWKPLSGPLETTAARIKRELAVGLDKDAVKACTLEKQNIRPAPGQVCPEGMAIVQADAMTDVRVLSTIMRTAKAAGFDNLMFAVKSK